MATQFLGAILLYRKDDGTVFAVVPNRETTDAVFFNSRGRDLYYRALQFCGKVEGDFDPYRIPGPAAQSEPTGLEEIFGRVLRWPGNGNGDGCVHCDDCMWWCPSDDARDYDGGEENCLDQSDIYVIDRPTR